MDKAAVKQQIYTMLKTYTRKADVWETATDESKILQDLKINSARLVDITLEMEDTFDIEIDNDAMDRIVTINDAIEVVMEKLG